MMKDRISLALNFLLVRIHDVLPSEIEVKGSFKFTEEKSQL